MALIDKETIRAEIERRIEENTCPKVHDDTEFSVWSAKDDLLDDILHLLDTLPEQEDILIIDKKEWEAQEGFRKNKKFGQPLPEQKENTEDDYCEEVFLCGKHFG